MGMEEDDDYADKKILVTEAADNPLKNRRIMAERLFEQVGFDGFQLVVQGMMSLFAEVYFWNLRFYLKSHLAMK